MPLANRMVEAIGFPAMASTNQTPSVRNTLPYVLVTKEPVDKALRLAAEAAGARVIGPYPPQAFLVEADAPALRRLAADARFVAATEFLPGDKVDENLTAALRGGAESVEATVVALAPADKAALQALVAAQDGEELKGCLCGEDSFRARLPAALVEALSKRGEVRWLELFRRPKLLNDLAVEPAAMNVRPVWNTHGLTGVGQVVSTSDSGIDTGDVATMHRDLRNRIAGIGVVDGCYATDTVGHGTHTAGSIVGDGTMSDGAIRGTAYGAKLWAWFCAGKDGDLHFPTYDAMFRPDQEQWPTFIHSASWGADADGDYDSDCRLFDDYVWKHADFLPVVSCGNAGGYGAETVGSPAAAKNVLTVGATQNLRTNGDGTRKNGNPTATASYSSRGPCKDGRVKPDVAAPGSGVLSTRAYGRSYTYGIGANANYAYNSGTSMATPLTAGAVALVREWLVDRCGFTNEPPSAALMKAIVVGGAKGAAVPNNDQGWGRVDLEETLFPSNRAVKLMDRLPFASDKTFKFVVETTNAAPLDVQLVWIDRPGTTGSWQTGPQLVNDLDLRVTAEADGPESVWYGNGGSDADHTNTVESVRLAQAPAARYLVTVACNRMTYDYLDGGAAALYLRGAFDPATVEEPTKVTVTVAVEAGPASADVRPSVGSLRVERGETVTFEAPEWAHQFSEYETPFARHACLGYSGTGDAPATGTSRSFSVVVSNDTSVTWRYGETAADFLFTYYAMLEGVSPRDYDPIVSCLWLTNGTTFTLELPGDAAAGDVCTYRGYYQAPDGSLHRGTFAFRLGMVTYAQTDSLDEFPLVSGENGKLWPAVDITMDEGVDLLCYYYNEDERTADGLPAWWYMRYLWGGASYLQYDGSAAGDPDGDGFSNAVEYADATDPVDDRSFRFEINAFTPTNVVYVGSVKGKMIVERSDRLDGVWKGVQTNDAPRTSVTNATSLTPVGNGGFYRIRHHGD